MIKFELPNEEYHRGEGYKEYLSSTQLKDYLISPKYAHLCRTDPNFQKETTEAMRKGTLFHDCMAFIVNGGTIQDYIDTLAIFEAPINSKTGQPYGTTTKAYQEAYQEWLSSDLVAGKTIITVADKEFISKTANAALENDIVRKMIKSGKPDDNLMRGPEISFFFKGETPQGNELLLKCRPDLLTNKRCIDWKTTSSKSLTADEIGRIIYSFGYDISSCFYQYILWKLTGKFYEFFWVFISVESNDCAVAGSSNIAFTCIQDLETFEQDTEKVCVFNPGVMRFRELLNLHIHCIDTDEWPGSEIFIEPDPAGIRIIEPELPAWAVKNPIKAYV